ncbi:MAG TPA: response regulator transcription factor [Acidimicrobiales bacterium]|nr:response regulator transcription factor [Acidimicrobiales bacterium]
MQILIVEDDRGISSFLEKGLRAEGYSPVLATNGDEALVALEIADHRIELVLLDLGLPSGDGEEVLRKLRQDGHSMPVIVLTARAEVAEKVKVLNAGANDYVTKPFSFEELLARIRAAVRTAGQPSASEIIVRDLRLDLLSKVAWRAGRRIDLAPREWALLELFMRHPTQVLSRAQILSRVWEYSFDTGSNVVDVYVGYLRRKLNMPGLSTMLVTVRGAGYRFIDDSE